LTLKLAGVAVHLLIETAIYWPVYGSVQWSGRAQEDMWVRRWDQGLRKTLHWNIAKSTTAFVGAEEFH